jgi:PAS domain S-box-containing protein
MHKIEPEVKNDKLLKSRRESEAATLQLTGLREAFADLYDFAPVGYATIDPDSRIRQINLTAASLLGLPRDELTGRRLSDFIHPADQDKFHIHRIGILAGSQIALCQLRIVSNDGIVLDVQMQSICHRPSPQAEPEIRVVLVDISDQQWMQRRRSLIQRCLEVTNEVDEIDHLLQVCTGEIKSFLSCEAVGIRVLDEQGRIPYKAYQGFSRSFCDFENPPSIRSDRRMCVNVIKGETDPNLPFFTARGSFSINASTRFLASLSPAQRAATGSFCSQYGYESVVLVPVTIDGKTIVGLIHGVDHRENMFAPEIVDILEDLGMHLAISMQRIITRKELERSHEELRFFSTQLLAAQENEQRRISMELHDGLGQDLNVLKLRLASIHSRLEKSQPALQKDSQLALDLIDGTINSVRRLAQGMSPSLLEDLGLSAALGWLIRNFTLECGVRVLAKPIRIDSYLHRDHQIILYRIVQETLTNVAKHANATTVSVNFRKKKGSLQITIQDNGQGFDVRGQQSKPNDDRGLGLAAMKLRAKMAGGHLEVASCAGKGTRIQVELPAMKKKACR